MEVTKQPIAKIIIRKRELWESRAIPGDPLGRQTEIWAEKCEK